METYEKNIMVRLSLDQRTKALLAAKDGDSSVSDIVRRSLDFYLAFPQAFLKKMEKAAAEAKLPVATVIVHLLQCYGAFDHAMIKIFGVSKTWQRAFRFTPEGKLIEGDELSDVLSKEAVGIAKELRRKLEETKKTGKPAKVAGEEICMIAELM